MPTTFLCFNRNSYGMAVIIKCKACLAMTGVRCAPGGRQSPGAGGCRGLQPSKRCVHRYPNRGSPGGLRYRRKNCLGVDRQGERDLRSLFLITSRMPACSSGHDQNAPDHKNRDDQRGTEAAEVEAAVRNRFGQKVADSRSERACKDEGRPEQ
jgi:hypothetical protein